MDQLLQIREQGTVETVNFTQRTCSEEGEDYFIGQYCLAFTWCVLHTSTN